MSKKISFLVVGYNFEINIDKKYCILIKKSEIRASQVGLGSYRKI